MSPRSIEIEKLAGHLVITVLHARSPQGAIQRMIDVQQEETRPAFRQALADMLRAVSVQVLPPRASGKGRLGAYGVLVPDEAMRSAIAAGRDPLDRADPLPDGCQTVAEDIQRPLAEGDVTEQAAAHALAAIGEP